MAITFPRLEYRSFVKKFVHIFNCFRSLFTKKEKNLELEQTFLYPWKRNSSNNLARYKLNNNENALLKKIRDQELLNPAPFSHQTLITYDAKFEKPIGFKYPNIHGEYKKFESVNIPISKIVGLTNTNNLDNYEEGMTFREILFKCLHGEGITQDSIDFLISSNPKNQPMPHVYNRDYPKSRSSGPIRIARCGEWYIIENGQQRSIIAIYAIWQKRGHNGVLQNVDVYELS